MNILRSLSRPLANSFFSRSSSTLSTIFALATGPQLRSGVAVIRVSGSSATQSLLALTHENDLTCFKPNHLYLRKLYHQQIKELIDESMVVWFKGKNRSSFFSIDMSFRCLRAKKFHRRRCCGIVTQENDWKRSLMTPKSRFSHIHGSKAVATAMFSVLSSFPNYRPAEPGEFSKRWSGIIWSGKNPSIDWRSL